MPFFTRTGDNGETNLFSGERISKNSQRMSVEGNLDELNSLVGLSITQIKDENMRNILFQVQNDLFVIGSEIATPEKEKVSYKIPEITADHVRRIEDYTNEIGNKIEPLQKFILPGGTVNAALFHTVRAVCRRTERSIVALAENEKINEEILKYCNRLSSLFFVLARFENKNSGVKDVEWNSQN